MAHIYRRRAKPGKQASQHSHIHFTSDPNNILNDPQVNLMVVCTHTDSYFGYTKKALGVGKNVLVEEPFTPTLGEAKALFSLASSRDLAAMPYQSRRFNFCFLTTKKVIESGKLGELVEIESHFDNCHLVAETNPDGPQNGEFYGLSVHTSDQIISLFGRLDHVSYDLRSLRNKANLDDTFEAQLFYGDLKAIIKTSHLVQIDYPKFIVHGHKGSLVKYGIDQQETSPKANIMPGESGFGVDDSVSELVYINEAGGTTREAVPLKTGDYGQAYDVLYGTLISGQLDYVRESDVLTSVEILERGFEQLPPATIILAK